MNERNLWDSVKHPIGLADMVHVGWVQRLLSSAESCGLPGPEPDLVAHGQTRVGPHARKIFEKFAELGIRYVGEPTDSQPGAQRIRPINEVLAFRKATCVDLCVAFCCAALDAGIYPLILTVTADGGLQRHAIALVPLDRMWAIGCEALLEDGFSRTPLEVDEYALRDVVVEYEDDPAGMWLAIDVQQVTESDGNWKTALSSGAEYVRDWEWDVCVDIGGLRSHNPDGALPPGGHIEKVLAPAYAELPEDFTPLQLMRARYGAVPYQQCDEIRQLREWATTTADATAPSQGGRSGDIAVAVVTGAGGSGKTRLAAQLCHDLSSIGWYAGFLPSTVDVTDEELSALKEVTTEVLVVVDYAEEARRGLVARVVRKLRARQSATRIVLTARGADQWWEEFREEAEQDGTVLSNTLSLSIRGKQEVEVDPWFFGRMYRRAVQQFSDKLNGAVPTDVEVPEGLGDTALDVVLRAWLAVCGNDELAKKHIPTREELYDGVLSIEFARWRKEPELRGISRDHLRRAAATLSLLAPKRDTDEIDDVLSRLPEWNHEHRLRNRLAEMVVQSLLRDDGTESVTLRPDPVAEHLILAVFGKKPELLDRVLPQDPAPVPGLDDADAEDSVVTRALEWGQQARNACVTLTRAASRDSEGARRLASRALRARPFLWWEALHVALTQGGPFAQALTALIESGADLPLDEIDDAIPLGHPVLAGAALAATRRLADSAEPSPEQRAYWANRLSIRLSAVGERGEALVAAREAVELYRALAEASPQDYRPDLAGALSNLANRLSAVGERDEAVGVAREAVGLYRGLAQASPQAFTPDLVGVLNNLATFLVESGHSENTLNVFVEGLDRLSPAVRAHLLVARADWREDGRKSEDLIAAAKEADATDAPEVLGPVRRMIARAAVEEGIPSTELPRWATVVVDPTHSRIVGWLECSDLALWAACLEADWALPSDLEREALSALAELYVDLPPVAALAALVERIADDGIQAVTTGLRIHHRVQVLARDWCEAHTGGQGARFLREHMRADVGAPREGGGNDTAMKTDPAEWDRDLSDPAMRSAVVDVLVEELPDVEATRMGLLLELADLSDPATAYEAYDSDEGAEDSLRHFLESQNWRAMLAVLGVRPGVADSAHGRIAALLAAAVGGESTERLRELFERANEAMDAIDRRHLQTLLVHARVTDQCPKGFSDLLRWNKA